jgi:hypothetical protein
MFVEISTREEVMQEKEVTGAGRNMHYEQIHSLCSSPGWQ